VVARQRRRPSGVPRVLGRPRARRGHQGDPRPPAPRGRARLAADRRRRAAPAQALVVARARRVRRAHRCGSSPT
jgi:hypothetical protein